MGVASTTRRPHKGWGAKLAHILQEEGRKQGWLAARLSVTTSYLGHAMHGDPGYKLTESQRRMAAAYLNRRYEEIFGEDVR